jgi:hypothetical protein
MSINWPVVKEVTGFLGAALAVLPWLRDFGRRRGWWKMKVIRTEGSLDDIRKELIAREETWLARAKPIDLGFTGFGLGLIAVSFVIGFCLAL